MPLCLNKYYEAGSIWAVEMTQTCRNFKPKPIPRNKLTQPTNPAIRLIPLNKGQAAIVDTEDYQKLAKFKWWLTKSHRSKCGYARAKINGRSVRMHRYLTNCPKGLVVDHIDGNGLNNTKAKLRICTYSQNACNTPGRSNKTSKYKGVCKANENKKFRAYIGINQKIIHIGYFKNEIEAAKAYDEAAKKYHGEFAYLNFPENI